MQWSVFSVQVSVLSVKSAVQFSVFSVQCPECNVHGIVQCGEGRGAGNGKFVPGREGGHCETTSQ